MQKFGNTELLYENGVLERKTALLARNLPNFCRNGCGLLRKCGFMEHRTNMNNKRTPLMLHTFSRNVTKCAE
jgi:hypothetical protein